MSNEQMRPASNEKAPDPSNTYERSHPENESGQGAVSANKAVPSKRPDSMEAAVTHKQDPTRQLNADDVVDQRSGAPNTPASAPAPVQPDHSMKDEEPTGWDMAPSEAKDDAAKRHPRTGGKGGTPDEGESRSSS